MAHRRCGDLRAQPLAERDVGAYRGKLPVPSAAMTVQRIGCRREMLEPIAAISSHMRRHVCATHWVSAPVARRKRSMSGSARSSSWSRPSSTWRRTATAVRSLVAEPKQNTLEFRTGSGGVHPGKPHATPAATYMAAQSHARVPSPFTAFSHLCFHRDCFAA